MSEQLERDTNERFASRIWATNRVVLFFVELF